MKLPIALPLLAIAAFTLLPMQAEPAKEQAPATAAAESEAAKTRLAELDAYWAIVSKAVNTGDFETYAATCHPEGVLVSGGKQMSQPLAAALAGSTIAPVSIGRDNARHHEAGAQHAAQRRCGARGGVCAAGCFSGGWRAGAGDCNYGWQ